MKRFAVLALLSVAACNGTSDPKLGESVDPTVPSGAYTTWQGNVDASRCGGTTPAVALRRCVADPGAASVALGVCGDLAADNTVTVDARDVAVAGSTRVASPLRVGASLTSVGGVRGDNTIDVAGDLRTSGPWSVSAPARVGGDAFTNALRADNTASIGGTLHAVATEGSGQVTAAATTAEPFAISSPLACTDAVDVAAAARASSDNEAIVVKTPADITVGCGEYVVAGIEAANELTFRVAGNAVLVIRGDLHIAAPTRIIVDPGATLDIVIGGSLRVDNTLSIEGGPTWLGVNGMVHIAAPMTLTGWLVAPGTDVGVDNTLSIAGAAYVRSLRVAAPLNITAGAPLDGRGCVVAN